MAYSFIDSYCNGCCLSVATISKNQNKSPGVAIPINIIPAVKPGLYFCNRIYYGLYNNLLQQFFL